MTMFRIGAGTGFAGDRREPAQILAQHGQLDALVFECLAERTIALAQQRLVTPGGVGYDELFLDRLDDVIPHTRGTAILTNAGAADPIGLARRVSERLHDVGDSRRVAAVIGDDVAAILPPDTRILETGSTIAELGDRFVSANAYVGAAAGVEALAAGADVVITGRMGDAAMFAAPLIHHHGWHLENLDRAADATLVGHLLECAGQLSGGYFAQDRDDVPDLARIGFPFADVTADGTAEFGKVEDTGGIINRATAIEQLLYEIDDPNSYKTPDVTLDLMQVKVTESGKDRVTISGAVPRGRPDTLKVSVGIRDGFRAHGSIGYAGRHALTRARMALEILRERWETVHHKDPGTLRYDLQGFNSLRPGADPEVEPPEVFARVGLRTVDRNEAVLLGREIDALYTNGPAGGGGVTTNVTRTTGIVSALIDRELVSPEVRFVS